MQHKYTIEFDGQFANCDTLKINDETVEEICTYEKVKIINELLVKIEEKLKEPAYQHEGENWQNGLILAQDILREYKSNQNENR